MEAVSHWQPHVVALDDDPAVRELLTEYLSENDLRVTALASGGELDATLARGWSSPVSYGVKALTDRGRGRLGQGHRKAPGPIDWDPAAVEAERPTWRGPLPEVLAAHPYLAREGRRGDTSSQRLLSEAK